KLRSSSRLAKRPSNASNRRLRGCHGTNPSMSFSTRRVRGRAARTTANTAMGMKGVERCGSALSALRRIVPIGAVLYTGLARAEVDFEPNVSAGVAHTDNVTLSAANREPETVYILNPGFTLTQDGRRMKSDVHYAAQGYYYADRNDSSVY